MNRLINRFLGLIERFDERFDETKWRPAWETISTFFFSLRTVNPLRGPHIRDHLDLKRYMSVVIAAVFPLVLMSVYLFGWRSLALVALSYTVGILIEIGFAIAKNEEVTEGMFVTCILFPMILPPTIPFWMAVVGIAVGIILGKEVFGGTGRNIFNPAIVGRVFLAVTFPAAMASRWVQPFTGLPGGFVHWAQSSDAVTVASTPVAMVSRLVEPSSSFLSGFVHWAQSSDAVTAATPLIDFKGGNAADLGNMFWGFTAGSLGETSAALILVFGTLLLLTRVANWRLTVSTIIGALALATVMHSVDPGRFASPLYHLFGGGLLFGAFFMVTDPVTAPFSGVGKWIYGGLIGVVTIVIRNLSGFPEGMMFAILLLNMFAPVIDDAIVAVKFRKAA